MFSGLRMGLAQEERCEALKVVVQSLLVVGPEVYALVSCARGTQPPGELLLASCAIPKTSTRERKPTNTSDWMLKSKAITDHGGGQAGEAAIDEAFAAGIYEEAAREVMTCHSSDVARWTQCQDVCGETVSLCEECGADLCMAHTKGHPYRGARCPFHARANTGLTEKARVGARVGASPREDSGFKGFPDQYMLWWRQQFKQQHAARLSAEREHAAAVHKKIRSEGPSCPSFDGKYWCLLWRCK